jgi:hypothetical protein
MKHDVDLMEHADGERELDLDGDERAKVEAIGELGELVRGRLELAADAVPDQKFAAMWREIDKGISTEDEPERAPAAGGGVWRRLAHFLDRYRGYIITGAVSAGAVAALALVFRGPSGDSGSQSGHEPIDVRPVVHRPAEIEDLETPGGTGTVFNLDDEDGSTTVIWVTPEDTVEGI